MKQILSCTMKTVSLNNLQDQSIWRFLKLIWYTVIQHTYVFNWKQSNMFDKNKFPTQTHVNLH